MNGSSRPKKRRPVAKRREPTQARARHTRDVILLAARDVLRKRGARALSTNRIAERAGVSIGTLYEYFPNKQAILVALAREQLSADERTLLAHTQPIPGEPLPTFVRRLVSAVLALHAHEYQIRRAAMGEHLAQGHRPEHSQLNEAVTTHVANALEQLEHPVSELARFTLTRAVLGAVHAAMHERPALLTEPVFERQVTALALAALHALREPAASFKPEP